MPDDLDMPMMPTGGLNTRDMLLLQGEQLRVLKESLDRLALSLEQRLAMGDRRFAELDARMVNTDARFTAANTAINSLMSRVVGLEDGARKIHAAIEQAEKDRIAAHEAEERARAAMQKEWDTWKTRIQTGAYLAGAVWALFQFVLPYVLK